MASLYQLLVTYLNKKYRVIDIIKKKICILILYQLLKIVLNLILKKKS